MYTRAPDRRISAAACERQHTRRNVGFWASARVSGLGDVLEPWTPQSSSGWRGPTRSPPRSGAEVAATDLSGRTVACHQHIVPDSICIVAPLLAAGARVRMAPCNPDSTDDRTAEHLASIGVEIRGRAGMSTAESADALEWLTSEPADALCDMGGELIVAMAAAGHRPPAPSKPPRRGCTVSPASTSPSPSSTGTGSRSRTSSTTAITSVPRRGQHSPRSWVCRCTAVRSSWSGSAPSVKGSRRGRELGANVTVVDRDPVRSVQALHHGCRAAETTTQSDGPA